MGRSLDPCQFDANRQLNNVIIAQVTPYAFADLKYKYFILFAATNCSNAVISYLLFPETKGKTLEEIGEYGIWVGTRLILSGLLFGDTDTRSYPVAGSDSNGMDFNGDKIDLEHSEHKV